MKITFRTLLLAAPAVLAGAFFLYGPENVWERLAGPADQGPVDFGSLSRRAVANDSLACTPGACAAPADFALPHYRAEPGQLMSRLDTIVGQGVARVDDASDPAYRRYVARTPLMRYPDTVDARAVRAADGTRLMLYSRSLIGSGDLGANRRRLETWAARLSD